MHVGNAPVSGESSQNSQMKASCRSCGATLTQGFIACLRNPNVFSFETPALQRLAISKAFIDPTSPQACSPVKWSIALRLSGKFGHAMRPQLQISIGCCRHWRHEELISMHPAVFRTSIADVFLPQQFQQLHAVGTCGASCWHHVPTQVRRGTFPRDVAARSFGLNT